MRFSSCLAILASVCLLNSCGGGVGGGGASPSSTGSQSPPATPPPSPTGLNVTPGDSVLTLAWTASPGTSSYSVYQANYSGGTGTLVQSGIPSNTVRIANLNNGQFYYLSVVATNAAGSSAPSTPIIAVPRAPLSANATLAAGVLRLTSGEVAQIASETAKNVVFNGTIDIPVGTVFITQDNAFVADQETAANGQVTIAVHPPRLDQLFSSLSVKGTVVFDESTFTPATGAMVRAHASAARRKDSYTSGSGAGSASLSTTFPIDESIGPFQTAGSITTSLAANIDYDYSKGTLNSAQLTISNSNLASLTSALAAGTFVSRDFSIGKFYSPIPGVLGLGVYIPASVLLEAKIQFDASLQLNGSAQTSASVGFLNGAVAAPSFTFDGSASASVSAGSVNTEGAAVYASLSATDAVLLHLRPALSFLNLVLAGVDMRAGPDGTATVQVTDGSPPFCLEVSKAIEAQAFGFFKAPGLNEESSALSHSYDFPPPATFGNCLPTPTVGGSIDASSLPASYFKTVQVDVSVASASPSGGHVPSGSVNVVMNGQSCTATLAADGTGQCSLPASPGGNGMPATLTYIGDSFFGVATAQMSVDVDTAPTEVSTSLFPATATINTRVSLPASVLASPTLPAGAANPTGNVEIDDSSGGALCEFDLADSGNGTGSCSTSFSTLGQVSVTTMYSGDSNYSRSQTTSTITVTNSEPGTCVPPAGKSTCSVTVYDVPGAFQSPVTATVTIVQVENGATTTTTNVKNIGVGIYDTIPAGQLGSPANPCNPNDPTIVCPPTTPHQFELCAVDGKYTPATYSSTVSAQYTNPPCTGITVHSDFITGYSLSADGTLTGTYEIKQYGDQSCYGTQTSKGKDDTLDKIKFLLTDGSGSSTESINDQETDTDSLNPNSDINLKITGSGSASWPAESASPPKFANTEIVATTTTFDAGQALPQSCIASGGSGSAATRAKVLHALSILGAGQPSHQ